MAFLLSAMFIFNMTGICYAQDNLLDAKQLVDEGKERIIALALKIKN